MEQIIDIAKQRLDTYKGEVYALLYLNHKIEKLDLLDAIRNMRRLADDIEDILTADNRYE